MAKRPTFLLRQMHTLKIKSKTPNHLIIQPNQPSSRHLPPPTALSGDFPAKKKIQPLGVAAIHPYG
jgi:hypothetical protein